VRYSKRLATATYVSPLFSASRLISSYVLALRRASHPSKRVVFAWDWRSSVGTLSDLQQVLKGISSAGVRIRLEVLMISAAACINNTAQFHSLKQPDSMMGNPLTRIYARRLLAHSDHLAIITVNAKCLRRCFWQLSRLFLPPMIADPSRNSVPPSCQFNRDQLP
jgi:hypothetical protein